MENNRTNSVQGESIGQHFFAASTVDVAKNLLGMSLVRRLGDVLLSGKIVETEAYVGDDPACHAYANYSAQLLTGRAPTGRSALLFGEPGVAYVYFNYGIHCLLNVVTEKNGTPGAVLLRAIEPTTGVTQMIKFRSHLRLSDELTNGPGKLTQAFNIGLNFNGKTFCQEEQIFFVKNCSIPSRDIVVSTRVGISKAQERPWRFFIRGNPYVSKPNGLALKR